MSEPARVVVIGAHPDDAEVKAAGTAVLWVRAGIDVTFVSMTDGGAGHHATWGRELADRRRKESAAAAEVLGVRSLNLDFPDGMLEPSLNARMEIVRWIRRLKADLVLTHRPNDYHPDHRYTSLLVQDSAYTVTVPSIACDVAPLSYNPVFGYLSDRFEKPNRFSPDVVVPIDGVMEQVVAALDCHESQFYEWLPYNMAIMDEVPADRAQRRSRLDTWYRGKYAMKALDLPEVHRPAGAEFIEAFEISEYGAPLDEEMRRRLFPFLLR